MQLRLILSAAVWVALSLGLPPTALWADGEIQVRGVYYKERATRVIQPVTDARLDLGPDSELSGHFLVDSITSASVASGAAGDAFTENRVEGGLAASHRFDTYQVGAFVRYSNEPDYTSLFGGLRSTVEMADRNSILGLAVALGSDDISNAGAQGGEMGQFEVVEGELRTVLASLSFTQLLSPQMDISATYDLIYNDGFLENPYRFVPVRGVQEAEEVPDIRLRHALFGRVRRFLPSTGTTLYAGYRFYTDDWDVRGHTPEVRLVQEVIRDFDIHLRYRYHRQSEAFFYRAQYDRLEEFLTDDVKLSAFSSHTMGIKLDSALANLGMRGKLAAMRLDLMLEYVVQNNRFGNALVAQMGLEIPLEY